MQWFRELSTFDSDRIYNELSAQDELVFLFPHQNRKSSELTREVLSKLTKTPLQDIELEKNEHGKPYWSQSPWHFNASDSGDWMLLGFSNKREVGVDIERERELRHSGKFPDRIMTELEQKDFDQVPSDQHLKRLIQSWSLKEAVLKCHGGSFFRDAHRIDVSFNPLRIRELPIEFETLTNWALYQTEFVSSQTYQVSLALFFRNR